MKDLRFTGQSTAPWLVLVVACGLLLSSWRGGAIKSESPSAARVWLPFVAGDYTGVRTPTPYPTHTPYPTPVTPYPPPGTPYPTSVTPYPTPGTPYPTPVTPYPAPVH